MPPYQAIAIVGHAIVSADGRIAEADGTMPPGLRNDADWRRFQAALDGAVLVVVGRLGHERHPNQGRPRLVITSSVTALKRMDDTTTLWNPAGLGFKAVLDELAIEAGTVAVTGGTRVFDLFLPRYDRFELATATRLEIPGGRPCFSGGPPAEILGNAGLVAGSSEPLDASAGVILTRWCRAVR